jgi:TRAP-type C4-dicarboxylate transport system substrate-binding protein
MRAFRALLAAAFAAAAGSTAASAQETTLIFATTNVHNIHANVRVLHPWAQRMNEQGRGVLKIDVRDGMTLANHINFYQRALDDVVQITWGIQSQVAGKFPRSHVVTLPFEAESAEQASVAYWRLYKTGLLNAEYDEIVPLMLIDEGIQRGTVDGAAIPWTAIWPFKLGEVTTYHVEAQLGNSLGVVFMTKKKYDALPAAARKVIDDNRGEAESRTFGAMWDSEHDKGREMARAMGGKHAIVALTPEQTARWRERIAPLAAEWAKSTPDGEKVLGAWRELLAKVKAGG